jgi:flagellar basal-body rod protein FlgC
MDKLDVPKVNEPVFLPGDKEKPVIVESGETLKPGHYELGGSEEDCTQFLKQARNLVENRAALEQLLLALNQSGKSNTSSSVTPNLGNGSNVRSGPLVIHAETPWAVEHLKALGIALEHTPSKTVLAAETDPEALNIALVKVLNVLRVRMGIHEQNLRNAERIRDAENRLNPYRRKTIKLGPQGEPIEGLDDTAFPKNYKPGDPNADAEGFVVLPNVNKAIETSEFQAAIEEYKLIRAVLEKIAPNQFFPEPPTLP